jgi:hypothetical protein
VQETILEHDVAKEANIKFSQMYLKPLARTNIVLSKSAILLEYKKFSENGSDTRLSVAVQK